MGIWDILIIGKEAWNEYQMGRAIGGLMYLDRDIAMESLQEVVHSLTPEQLARFEVTFLNASMGVFDWDQRIRIMELFAFFKMVEAAHYKQWRFSTATKKEALA